MYRDSNTPHLHSLRKLRLVHLDLESTFHSSMQMFMFPVFWKDSWVQENGWRPDSDRSVVNPGAKPRELPPERMADWVEDQRENFEARQSYSGFRIAIATIRESVSRAR